MTGAFGRAVQYGVKNYIRAVAVLLGVVTLFPLLLTTVFSQIGDRVDATFNGFGISGAIFGLVMGIVGIRETLRVLNQNGVCRRTAFAAELVSQLVVILLVSLGCILIPALFHCIDPNGTEFQDLYQLLYEQETLAAGMAPAGYARSILFSCTTMLLMTAVGQCLSLLYWRLTKLWMVVVSVGLSALVFLGPAAAFSLLGGTAAGKAAVKALMALGTFLMASPWNAMLAQLLAALAFLLLSWLLARRVSIQAAK